MANYHPNDELLMHFAAGQLANPLGVMIACHLEQCATCKQQVASYEALGGEILDSIQAEAVNKDVLTSVLSKIDEPEKPSASQSSHIANSNIPRPLRRYVPNNYADLHWQKVLQNIYEYRIPIEDQRYTAKFYRISAGKELPEHTHRGKEYTFVMEGSFSDRTSHYYEGDFIIADDQVVHKPHASEDSDCICFAVTDAPLKMTGYFSRVINPFLK